MSVLLGLVAALTGASEPHNPGYDRYLQPAELVEVAPGRRLNLRCEGEGGPTILLEAGLGYPSLSWRDVQPRLARLARVCAYDRAGLGFSDAGPMPRSAAALADDLEALVARAGLRPPFLLVGNSLGGQIVRLFAFRRPEQVVGLVLLDPYVEGQFPALAAVEPSLRDELAQVARDEERCVAALRRGQLSRDAAVQQGCIAGPSPTFSSALNELLQRQRMQPAWFETAFSESRMLDTRNEREVRAAQRHLGSIPLIVLQAGRNFESPRFHTTRSALRAEQQRLYQALASLSHKGEVRLVEAEHAIQVSNPDTVVAAVRDILRRMP